MKMYCTYIKYIKKGDSYLHQSVFMHFPLIKIEQHFLKGERVSTMSFSTSAEVTIYS